MKSINLEIRKSHSGPVAAAAVSDDLVITGAYDGRVGWWRHEARSLTPLGFAYLHAKGVNCVAISPDGKLAASGGSDGIACIIRLQNAQADMTICSHPGDVESIVFTADSRFVMTGGTDGKTRLFSAEDGREILHVCHGKTVGALARHFNPEFIVSGSNDRKLRLIRVADGKVMAEASTHTGPVKTIGVVECGILSSGHDQSLLLHGFDLQPQGEITRFSTTPKTIAVEPDGRHFWTGVYDQRTTRWTEAGEAAAFRPEASLFHARAWAHGLAAGPGFAVIGSFDGSPILLTAKGGGELEARQETAAVDCISTSAVTAAGIALAGDSGEIRFAAKAPRGSAVASAGVTTSFGAVPGAITSIVGDRDDLMVASWDGEITRLRNGVGLWKARWDDDGGRAGSPILRVARSNGRVLAGLYTGGAVCFREDDATRLWANGEATGAVKCVALAGDVFALTGRYDPLRVGDARTGEIHARLPLETPVSDVAVFSPFSSHERPRLAVAAGDNEVWVVDLVRGESWWRLDLLHRSPGHTLPIKALAWAADDVVYAGDYSGAILRHRIGCSSEQFLQVQCRTGVSSLAFADGVLMWTTFDGHIGSSAARIPVPMAW